MARVHPFRALRFQPERADLSSVVAPASAAVDDVARAVLLEREPRNVVRATAPAREAGDTDEIVGRRAAFHLAEWRRAGVLELDEYPCLYALRSTLPGAEGAEATVVQGFFAAVGLDDPESIVLGERTDDGAVDAASARLRQLGHQAEAAVMLYSDEKGRISRAIASEMEERDPDARAELDGGVHELWMIDDETTLARVTALLESQRVYVVEGAERVAGAIALERSLARVAAGAEREATSALGFFVAADDAAARLRGVHRVASWMGTRDLAQILGESQRFFRRTEVPADVSLVETLARSEARAAFGVWLRYAGSWLFELLDDVPVADLPGVEPAPNIDAQVVDQVMLKSLLGVDPESGDVRFVGEDQISARMMEEADNDAALLMRAPRVEQVVEAADGGAPLPRGSVAFHPAPPTGLVFSPLVAIVDEDE